jgi:hypothetical protein
LVLVSSAVVASRWPGFQRWSDCSIARATAFADRAASFDLGAQQTAFVLDVDDGGEPGELRPALVEECSRNQIALAAGPCDGIADLSCGYLTQAEPSGFLLKIGRREHRSPLAELLGGEGYGAMGGKLTLCRDHVAMVGLRSIGHCGFDQRLPRILAEPCGIGGRAPLPDKTCPVDVLLRLAGIERGDLLLCRRCCIAGLPALGEPGLDLRCAFTECADGRHRW